MRDPHCLVQLKHHKVDVNTQPCAAGLTLPIPSLTIAGSHHLGTQTCTDTLHGLWSHLRGLQVLLLQVLLRVPRIVQLSRLVLQRGLGLHRRNTHWCPAHDCSNKCTAEASTVQHASACNAWRLAVQYCGALWHLVILHLLAAKIAQLHSPQRDGQALHAIHESLEASHVIFSVTVIRTRSAACAACR